MQILHNDDDVHLHLHQLSHRAGASADTFFSYIWSGSPTNTEHMEILTHHKVAPLSCFLSRWPPLSRSCWATRAASRRRSSAHRESRPVDRMSQQERIHICFCSLNRGNPKTSVRFLNRMKHVKKMVFFSCRTVCTNKMTFEMDKGN